VLLVLAAGAGCHKRSEEEAVRQGVIDYLSKRSNLNVSGMNVTVVSLVVRANEADADISFTAKGANPGQGMLRRYTLERQGDHWVVKNSVDTGSSPHGAGAGGGQALPAGHPPVESMTPKK